MWDYQTPFQILVELGIKQALSAIGLPVEVRVVLVGFARDPSLPHQICIEPEGDELQVDHLSGVSDRTNELAQTDPTAQLIHANARLNTLRGQRLLRGSRARALVEAIEASHVFKGLTFFASSSSPIDDYEVHTCVGVPTADLEVLSALDSPVVDGVNVGQSLQQEVIAECLVRADRALYFPDPGAGPPPIGLAEDIIKAAATRLAYGAAHRATGRLIELFSYINAFTSLTYERAGARGRIAVVSDKEATARLSVRFKQPIPLSQARRMRKILHLSDDSLAVLVGQQGAYGLGSCASGTDVVDIFVKDHAQWEMSIDGLALMRVTNGQPTLPRPPLDFEGFGDTARRVLGPIELNRIWAIIEKAQASGHGMMLVVSSDPEGETARLGAEAVPIEPQNLKPAEVVRLGRVDGAVLLGPNGFCHAFGVILDGAAAGRGDPGRGARYNSAVRYHYSADTADSVLIVISDDGLVDLIPQAHKRVRKEDVESAVRDFTACCEAEPVDGGRFSRTLKRVEGFAFYLDEAQCQIVNNHYESEMRRRFESGGLRLPRTPLQPHPGMNDSYFA